MKTANLFIDYLIVGFLSVACFLIPYFMIFRDTSFLHYSIEGKGYTIIPILTIAIYIIGLIFNQVFDRLISLLEKILKTESVAKERNLFPRKLSHTYHECLQFIVCNSTNAYDYLSFRRTVIRILRASIGSSIFILILYPIYLIIASINYELEFSIVNTVIILLVLCFIIFLRYIYIKTHIGYYKAIINFYKTLKDE